MSALLTKVQAARILMEHRGLAESAVGYEPLIRTADEWRTFIRLGDAFLEAVDSVVQAAERASAEEDPTMARRYGADVSGAMRRVVSVTGKAYTHFASGRTFMYEFAKLFDVSTKRSSGVHKGQQPLEGMSDAELRSAIAKGASGLGHGITQMLNLGAKVANEYRDGARLVSSADAPFDETGAKALVERGLDFRDSVGGNVFARTNGVMRRAAELTRRTWDKMMQEDSKLGWVAPWAHDPEFGGAEN